MKKERKSDEISMLHLYQNNIDDTYTYLVRTHPGEFSYFNDIGISASGYFKESNGSKWLFSIDEYRKNDHLNYKGTYTNMVYDIKKHRTLYQVRIV